MNSSSKRFLGLALGLIVAMPATWSCRSGATDKSPGLHEDAAAAGARLSPPTLRDEKPRDYPGIHNAAAYDDGFISGSAPEGDEGFQTLAALGVKTVISVDGAVPDVETAERYGLRYIHLPIGYNGFSEQRKLELVRATRDAERLGPVYIHCHHGKHRSAGAAAAVAVGLGWLAPAEAVARMKVSGTAPNYKGLYACAEQSVVLAESVIDAVPADFPAQWKPSGYVSGMVETDEVFERLKSIEKAAWQTPADHPDLVPAAEAGRLADLFRVLTESEYTQRKGGEFLAQMQQAHGEAQLLEDWIIAGTEPARLSEQFKLVGASCKSCHAQYRD